MTGESQQSELQHDLKNQLAIISGYCDLLLSEAPREHAWYADLLEIQKAAAAALTLLQPRST